MPALFVVLISLMICKAAESKTYGAAVDLKKAEKVELAAVFAKPQSYEGRKIIIQGTTGLVCQSAGCWLMLKDGSNQIMVQFFTFTVRPPVGSKIRAQGVLKLQNGVPYLVAEGLDVL